MLYCIFELTTITYPPLSPSAVARFSGNASAVLFGNANTVLFGNASAVLFGNASAVLFDNASTVCNWGTKEEQNTIAPDHGMQPFAVVHV